MDHVLPNTSNNNSVNALLLLFVFDKMDIPLTENTLAEMVCTINEWVSYMDYRQALSMLLDKNWIGKIDPNVPDDEAYFTLTVDGRVCLSHLFYNIPSRIRAEIVEYINENRMYYRRKQEYNSTYSQNADGTYTVTLKISDATRPLLSLDLCVPDRNTAKEIHRKWEEKAAEVYALLYESLLI